VCAAGQQASAFTERWGADSVWWSYPLSSAFATFLAIMYYKFGGWRTATMERPAQPA